MNGVKQQYIHFYKLRNECSTVSHSIHISHHALGGTSSHLSLRCDFSAVILQTLQSAASDLLISCRDLSFTFGVMNEDKYIAKSDFRFQCLHPL